MKPEESLHIERPAEPGPPKSSSFFLFWQTPHDSGVENFETFVLLRRRILALKSQHPAFMLNLHVIYGVRMPGME